MRPACVGHVCPILIRGIPRSCPTCSTPLVYDLTIIKKIQWNKERKVGTTENPSPPQLSRLHTLGLAIRFLFLLGCNCYCIKQKLMSIFIHSATVLNQLQGMQLAKPSAFLSQPCKKMFPTTGLDQPEPNRAEICKSFLST